MSFTVAVIDPVTKIQSKYTDDEGKLRYSIDKSLVFPHPTGVRENGSFVQQFDTLEEARREAHIVVIERMQAFGEDPDALKQYGYIAAEIQAMDMTDEGGKITLQDGWIIEVTNEEEM